MNTLSATITSVTSSQHLSSICVRVGDEPFYLLLAEASSEDDLLHTAVTLAFKETEVILFNSFAYATANIHKALVENIEKGFILTQVTLSYHQTIMCALVPTVTFDALGINKGDEIYWLVSPSEISLLRGTHGI